MQVNITGRSWHCPLFYSRSQLFVSEQSYRQHVSVTNTAKNPSALIGTHNMGAVTQFMAENVNLYVVDWLWSHILPSSKKYFSLETTKLLSEHSDISLTNWDTVFFHSVVVAWTNCVWNSIRSIWRCWGHHKLEHRIQSYSIACLIETTISAFWLVSKGREWSYFCLVTCFPLGARFQACNLFKGRSDSIGCKNAQAPVKAS